jgi:uroporphyrinogen III methyltransferase/synthase
MKGPDLAGWSRTGAPATSGARLNGSGSSSASPGRATEPADRRTLPLADISRSATTLSLGRSPVACGRVAFVGAGPGDPGLMTIRSRELLALADVVVVDDLAEDFVRTFARADARVVSVSRHTRSTAPEELARESNGTASAAAAAVAVDDLGEELVTQAIALPPGSLVVRLMYGDPMAFNGLAAEALALRRANISFDVVPGVSPLTAAPAYAGVPLTSGCATSVQVVHAGREPQSWGPAVEESVTVVVVGSGPRIAQTLEGLLKAGRDPLTPVAVIEGGTTTLQASRVTTLAKVSHLLADNGTGFPIVAVASHTVGLREALSWFETKALFGWDVLVPSTKEATDSVTDRLAAYGARTTVVPTIAVELPRTPQQMERAVKGLVTGHYEWVAFTSANTVRAVRAKVEAFGLDARAFAGVRIAAVGGLTIAALRDWGISADLIPSGEQSMAGLLEDWPEFDEDLDPMRSVLVPRADIATDALVSGLGDLGWEVDDITAFRTVRAAPPAATVREAIKSGSFDAVVFTSSSTVRNLVGIAGKPHPQTVVACVGPQTAATAREHGLRVDVVAELPSSEALVDALAAHGTLLAMRAREAGTTPRRPSEPLRSRRRSR